MSVYDDMYGCIEGALSTDTCDYSVYSEMCDLIAEAEAENAKLRELVRDMNKAAHMLCEAWEGSCSEEAEGMSLHEVCPIGDTSELCVFGRLDERMQELGIEVD